MPAQRHDTAACAPDIAEQELDDGGRANNLHTLRLLRPAHRVANGAGALASGIFDQRLSHLQPLFARHAAYLFHHLLRITRKVAAHHLEDTTWMVQRRVGYGLAVLVTLVVPTAR